MNGERTLSVITDSSTGLVAVRLEVAGHTFAYVANCWREIVKEMGRDACCPSTAIAWSDVAWAKDCLRRHFPETNLTSRFMKFLGKILG